MTPECGSLVGHFFFRSFITFPAVLFCILRTSAETFFAYLAFPCRYRSRALLVLCSDPFLTSSGLKNSPRAVRVLCLVPPYRSTPSTPIFLQARSHLESGILHLRYENNIPIISGHSRIVVRWRYQWF